MKNRIILFVLTALILASCSTTYKSGQTPDDLYAATGKVAANREEKKENNDISYEERKIRMAARDPRWRTLDDRYDYDYNYSPYYYGYNYGYYYNPSHYNYPMYSGGIKFVNPKNTSIRTTNLNTYSNTITTYSPTKGGEKIKVTTVRGYNEGNGRTIRNVNMDTRAYTPSNNNSSSNHNSNSSHSNNNSSSGTSVTRPSRN